MDTPFWLDRWSQKQIGFHQAEINPFLIRHWGSLSLATASTVFVPLCGKTLDMVWLAKQGHQVVGVELAEIALREFFARQNLTPTCTRHGEHVCWQAGAFQLWQGDFFTLPDAARHNLLKVSAVYDRAALVALPDEMRPDYIATLNALMPHYPPQLLLTFEYAQAEMRGPPFAVMEAEVRDAKIGYGGSHQINVLEATQGHDAVPRFREKGVTQVAEKCYLLTPLLHQ